MRTSTIVFTGEPTELSLLVEPGYPNPTADSGRWASPRWRTKSSSRRCYGYCKASTSRTFSVSAMASVRVAASIKALDALSVAITDKRVNWILDADIEGFFDTIDHDWLVKFLEHRIGDRRILRLIRKWLRAGVSEEGEWSKTTVGDTARAVISPLLANVYPALRASTCGLSGGGRHRCRGDVIVVRYADDFVMGFEHRSEAPSLSGGTPHTVRQVWSAAPPRENASDRVRPLCGSNDENDGARADRETFRFSWLHASCVAKTRTTGLVHGPSDSSMAKRMRATLQRDQASSCVSGCTDRSAKRDDGCGSVVQGWLNYHAVPCNWRRHRTVSSTSVTRLWLHVLTASQPARSPPLDVGTDASPCSDDIFPRPKILHPYPDINDFTPDFKVRAV